MTTLTSTQPSTPQKLTGKAQEPKLFHPALQFDPFSTLCSYNNLQSLYATVDASSLQPKVLIYNVKDSKPILDFTLLEGPSTNKISCLKWLTKPEVNTKKPSNKDPFSRFKNCLLIGFQTGEIFIYSLIESSIIIKFSGHHTGAINDIFQLEELIFAGSADEHLSLWDLSKGELIKYWRPNNGQITKLIANKKSSQLICAGNSLQIWDYEDFTLLKTLRGHTGSISTLDYFGSQDRYFLSSSPLDPLVNVWDRLHDSQLPIAVLDLKTHLPCQLIGAKFSTTYSAVVLTSDGLVLTYNDVLNIERNSHLPSATLKFYNPQNNSILPVSSLTWDKSYNLPLVARGLPTTPIFETLQVKLKLLKGPELYPREDIQQTSNNTGLDSKVQQEAMDLIVGTSFAQTITSTQVNSKFMVPTAIATAQRLNLLDEGRGDSPSVASGTNTGDKAVGDGKATTGSVIQLLSQALHTMDYDMLDSHLNTFNSPTLVQTIPHLETRHLVPLLTYLSNQLEFSNHTSIKALTLINALLTYHVGYLTSQPKAVHRLHQLMEGSKRRTSHYSQLVKLEGELELVQNRINLRKQTFFNEGSLVFKEARGYLNSKEQGENFEGEEDDEEDKMDLIEFDDYEDDDSELEGTDDEENSDEDDSESEQLIEDDLSKEARLEANLNKNGFFDDEEDSEDDSNDELANGNHDSDEDDEELEEDDEDDIEEESEEDDLDDLDLPTTSNKRKPNGVHQRKRAKH